MGVLNSKVIIKTSSQEDATAIPDDVIKGKIFYNKKGKQTGTLNKLSLENLRAIYGSDLKSVTVNKNQMVSVPTITEKDYYIRVTDYGQGLAIGSIYEGYSNITINKAFTFTGKIIGIEFQSDILILPFATNFPQNLYGINIKESSTNPIIIRHSKSDNKNYVSFFQSDDTRSITIFYK